MKTEKQIDECYLEFKSYTLQIFKELLPHGIKVNFKGYFETIVSIRGSPIFSFDDWAGTVKDLTVWHAYFCEVHAAIKSISKSLENRILYYKSFRTVQRNNRLENDITSYEKKKKDFDIYLILLRKQIKIMNALIKQASDEIDECATKYRR